MNSVLSKKELYSLMLKDRLPVAEIPLPIGRGRVAGELDIYICPLGLLLRAGGFGDRSLGEIKIFDRKRGRFVRSGLFCSDGTVELEDGSLISLCTQVCAEDLIGSEFLVSVGDMTIASRAVRVSLREK